MTSTLLGGQAQESRMTGRRVRYTLLFHLSRNSFDLDCQMSTST